MADVKVPYLDAGRASFEELDNFLTDFAVMGDRPPLLTYPMPCAATQTFAQFEVVAKNASGHLIPATFTTGGIGVVTQAVTSTAVAGETTVPVFYSGNFNIDALVWGATFDTDAKKLAAFEGADSPTQIVVAKRNT